MLKAKNSRHVIVGQHVDTRAIQANTRPEGMHGCVLGSNVDYCGGCRRRNDADGHDYKEESGLQDGGFLRRNVRKKYGTFLLDPKLPSKSRKAFTENNIGAISVLVPLLAKADEKRAG
jgi:hypothetical protein